MQTTLTVDDLTPIEQTYLGVLALGLVSADQARDPRFRMEYICARTHALRHSEPETTYLGTGACEASPEFRDALRAAILDLDAKRVIGIGAPVELVIMPETPAGDAPVSPGRAAESVDVNRHPPIFGRYLAQRCMEELLNVPAIYDYLMSLYADSSDIWGALYEQGYGQYR